MDATAMDAAYGSHRWSVSADGCEACGISALEWMANGGPWCGEWAEKRGLVRAVLNEAQDPPAPEPSPNADCADCTPPHPYRLHQPNGGYCSVASCPCTQFREAPSALAKVTHCYICGRPGHARGGCPFLPKPSRKVGPP